MSEQLTQFQQTLFNDLFKLVQDSEAFFMSTFELEGRTYVIFNYRLASYTDFLQPGALEARGIMFEVDPSQDSLVPIRLASLPLPKFFNYRENPFTMDIDFTRTKYVHDKADGSLISTYLHDGNDVRLKTKGSLFSDQVYQAEKFLFLDDEKQIPLADDVSYLTELGMTVNMEWCAPHNRIVIGYQQPSLKVLAIRNNSDGSFVSRQQARDQYGCQAIYDNWVYEYQVDDVEQLIADLPDQTGIEGVVVTLDDDHMVKLKTTWYTTRHHVKDSINIPRRLFEAVIEEATDDMRAMLWDDPVALEQIDQMEQFVDHKYNHMVEVVENFYHENKNLDRKNYAIKGKEQLDKMYFSLAMDRYVGKDVNYKQFLKKQWRTFVSDTNEEK